MEQYDAISSKYAALTKIDFVKSYSQYPTMLQLVGNLKNKKLLDVGCGDGLFTKKLASKSKFVLGYDNSREQIAIAKEEKNNNITYLVSNPRNISVILKNKRIGNFDVATACLVLLYARNNKNLRQFFDSTSDLLKKEGLFVGVTYNPEYRRIGKIFYNRRFSKKNKNVQVEFFDENKRLFSAEFTDFTKKDYELCAKNAGFDLVWKPMKISPMGVKKAGKSFWKNYLKDCPYIAFVARKK